MDCRILRQIMIKADGNLVCDDSNGYFINLGQVSLASGWSITQVLTGGVYAHVRRSFQEGRVPWPSICESCDIFSANGIARDTLDTRMRIMVEPTLSCRLACPTCKRGLEANRRQGSWDLDPVIFRALLESCAKSGITVEEIHYIGWGEPLLHRDFAELTRIARHCAPRAVQEVTTTGNVDFHDGLRDADLDRVVISCDGVRQNSYAKFRRNGELATVFRFMGDATSAFASRPFVEWKYIVFEHNDSDEELIEAQAIADVNGIDSLLFILTNSKQRSMRYQVDTINAFPIRSERASVIPAAAIMKTQWTGRMIAGQSSLGAGCNAMLYLDRCTITETRMVVLEGWALAADMHYLDSLEVIVGNEVRWHGRTVHRRLDVVAHHPTAKGPDCGFVIRFRIDEVAPTMSFLFAAKTATASESFRAEVAFNLAREPVPA